MNITVMGKKKRRRRARLPLERADRRVIRLGRGGGDTSEADAVLAAVPPDPIAEALGRVNGPPLTHLGEHFELRMLSKMR